MCTFALCQFSFITHYLKYKEKIFFSIFNITKIIKMEAGGCKKKQEKVSRHMRYAELFSLMKAQVICV